MIAVNHKYFKGNGGNANIPKQYEVLPDQEAFKLLKKNLANTQDMLKHGLEQASKSSPAISTTGLQERLRKDMIELWQAENEQTPLAKAAKGFKSFVASLVSRCFKKSRNT